MGILVPVPQPVLPVPVLLEGLKQPDAEVRAKAAWDLTGSGEGTTEVIDALLTASHDSERRVRYAGVWALGHLTSHEAHVATESLSDTQPKILHQTKPKYPERAFHKGVEGTVLIDVLIGEEGEVFYAEVRRSITGLDDAALTCVKQWQFAPATKAGRPVPTHAQAPMTFRIFEDAPPRPANGAH